MVRLLLALCLTVLALVDHVHAWYGTVTFYRHIKWDGPDFPWGITETNRCYNLSCFNKRAASIQWEGVKTTGEIDDSGRSYIAFYLEPKCKGQAYWWAIDADQPSTSRPTGLARRSRPS